MSNPFLRGARTQLTPDNCFKSCNPTTTARATAATASCIFAPSAAKHYSSVHTHARINSHGHANNVRAATCRQTLLQAKDDTVQILTVSLRPPLCTAHSLQARPEDGLMRAQRAPVNVAQRVHTREELARRLLNLVGQCTTTRMSSSRTPSVRVAAGISHAAPR